MTLIKGPDIKKMNDLPWWTLIKKKKKNYDEL